MQGAASILLPRTVDVKLEVYQKVADTFDAALLHQAVQEQVLSGPHLKVFACTLLRWQKLC
jgi:hypothetical protein